ncbi:MAG: hypothetical protein ACPL88_10725, partial [Bryobacteraceae bacterium]
EYDLLTISVKPNGEGPAPLVSASELGLEAGSSASITVHWSVNNLAPGVYDGFVLVRGTRSPVELRIPYWYAVPTGQPAWLTVLYARTEGGAGASLRRAIYFRLTDSTGVPVRDQRPEVTVLTEGAEVTDVTLVDAEIPGAYAVSVRLAPAGGRNDFRIRAGDLQRTVTIVGLRNP